MIRRLSPLRSKKPANVHDFYTLDTETWGLSPKPENLAFGIIYQPGYYRIFYNVIELETILKQRRFRNRKIFAHNAEYDLSAIWGNIYKDLDNEAIFNNRFISARKGSTYFHDSFNLIPFSLEKIGKQLGFPKGITPEKFFKTSNKRKFDIEQSDIEYCLQDCKVLHKALSDFFEVTGRIKMTIGSMSINYFREHFLERSIFYNQHNEKFFNSYYGGRTEAFYLGKCKAKAIDINSLYPYVMKETRFPDSRTLRKGLNKTVRYFERILKNYEGCAYVTLIHNETKYGFLPYKHNNRLCFPIGKLTGWWNFNELLFAYNHGVIEILDVHEYYYSPGIRSPFVKFVEQVYEKRNENEGKYLNVVYKLLMNNLYGKFAQRKKFKRTYYESPPFEYMSELHKAGKWFHVQTLGAEREDIFLIEKNTKMEKSHTAIPSFASYITSAARIKLLKSILENSQKIRILYSDTDSIFYEGDLNNTNINLGNELGQWKIEDKEIIEIRGLKNYTVIENGKRTDKIKGIPKKAKKVNGKYQYETYSKTLSGLREINGNDTGTNFKMVKRLTGNYTKRIVLQNGETEPIII